MKKIIHLLFILVMTLTLAACKKPDKVVLPDLQELQGEQTGVYYEIFVRSFSDSDGDGIGDLKGIINKMDYLDELGVEGLWLMPIYESDTYHGYDVRDYRKINDEYGTMEDFQDLLDEAKARDIKVILDIPFNHTSNLHEWFIKSQDVDSEYRDYYVWIDRSDDRFGKTGSWGQNIWHYTVDNNNYYAGYFSHTMPDLNMENPTVRQEIKDIADYWLSLGVDGFRLDAALHHYGENEYAGNHSILGKNISFWKEFKDDITVEHPNVYLVGEVWTDSMIVAPFFSELNSNFNFDISDLIINSLYSHNSSYAKTIIRQHEDFRLYNSDFIDAPFLSNHDGNNKEPKARIATLLDGNNSRIRLAAEMLLTLPGNPFIYYGEELGMEGSKAGAPDYDKPLRSPMLFEDNQTTWYTNTAYNQGVASADEQMDDPNSLFNHYKALITLRKSSLALHDGDINFYSVGSRPFQSFVRYYENEDYKYEEAVLVVHNVSNEQVELNFNNSEQLEVIYESNNTNYNETQKMGPRSTIVFKIPNNMIDKFVK